MKKLICILAGAALLVGCGQKSEVAAPATPAPEKKIDTTMMGERPKKRKLDASSATVEKVEPEIRADQSAMMAASPTP
jgi:uncharacterized lipoprotein YajG